MAQATSAEMSVPSLGSSWIKRHSRSGEMPLPPRWRTQAVSQAATWRLKLGVPACAPPRLEPTPRKTMYWRAFGHSAIQASNSLVSSARRWVARELTGEHHAACCPRSVDEVALQMLEELRTVFRGQAVAAVAVGVAPTAEPERGFLGELERPDVDCQRDPCRRPASGLSTTIWPW